MMLSGMLQAVTVGQQRCAFVSASAPLELHCRWLCNRPACICICFCTAALTDAWARRQRRGAAARAVLCAILPFKHGCAQRTRKCVLHLEQRGPIAACRCENGRGQTDSELLNSGSKLALTSVEATACMSAHSNACEGVFEHRKVALCEPALARFR